MSRKLKFVQTHQVLFVAGLGQMKTTLTASDMPGLELTYEAEGVYAKYKGVSFIIPLANVCVAVFLDQG